MPLSSSLLEQLKSAVVMLLLRASGFVIHVAHGIIHFYGEILVPVLPSPKEV